MNFLWFQLENEIKNDISNDIANTCRGLDCKLNTTANCEDDIEKEAKEDRTNIIKRDTSKKSDRETKKKDQNIIHIRFQLHVKSKLNKTVNTDKIRTSLSGNTKYKIKLNKVQVICPNGYMQRKSKCGTITNLFTL